MKNNSKNINIVKAELSDLETVRNITAETIRVIYPHYYPKGAVEFFLEHHNKEKIIGDINNNSVYLCFYEDKKAIGTVTINQNEICRLFVLPEYQKNGFGCALLDYCEKLISERYNTVSVASSLPAKQIYLERGYISVNSSTIDVKYHDKLCYDTMIKYVAEF